MAAVLLINGYPGSGKSTVGRAVADHLPGAFWCDVDDLMGRLTPQGDEHPGVAARRMVTSLIAHQASEARPLVISQLTADQEVVDAWRRAAVSSGSSFTEVMLVVDRDTAFERVLARGGQQLADLGELGDARLAFDRLCDRLDDRLDHRADVTFVSDGDLASVISSTNTVWPPETGQLSALEHEVATLAAEGLPLPAIAQKLNRSHAACSSALDRTYAKLGVSDRKGLHRRLLN